MKIYVSNIKSFFLENKTIHQIIFKNTFWLMLAEGIGKIVAFFIMILLARHFGPGNYGIFAFAISFVSLSSVFGDFGISTLTIRELSRDKSKTIEYIDNALALKVIISVIVFSVLTLVINLLGRGPETIMIVYLLAICMIMDSFSLFFQSIFIAYQKMQYAAVCKVLVNIILLGLMFGFVSGGLTIVNINYAYLIASFIGLLLSSIIIWKYFSRFFVGINKKIIIEIFKKAWPFCLISFLFVAYYYLASIWLGLVKTSTDVGIYNVAFRTSFFATTFAVVIFNSFLPLISRFFKEDTKKLNEICTKYATVVLLFGIPLGFGGTVLAPEIIKFFYASAYVAAILPFQILVWGVATNFLQCIYCNCLLACDRQKDVFKIVVLGVVFNALVNYILIFRYGVMGAAIGVLLTEFFIFLIARSIFDKVTKIKIINIVSPIILASVLMSLCLIIAKFIGISQVIALLILGIFSYAVSIYYIFLKKHKGFLKEIFLGKISNEVI